MVLFPQSILDPRVLKLSYMKDIVKPVVTGKSVFGFFVTNC